MEPRTRSAKAKTRSESIASKPGGTLYATGVEPTESVLPPVRAPVLAAAVLAPVPVVTTVTPAAAASDLGVAVSTPAVAAVATPAVPAAAVPTVAPALDLSGSAAVLSPMTTAAGVAAGNAAPPAHAPVHAPAAAPHAAVAATPAVVATPVATVIAAPAVVTTAAASAAPKQFVAAGAVLSQAEQGVLPAGFPPAPTGLPLLQWADNYWFEHIGAPAPAEMPPAPSNLNRQQWAAKWVYSKQQSALQASKASADGYAAAPAPSAAPGATVMTLQWTTKYDSGATCNDGTPSGFYYAAGTDPTLWIVYLQGGLWCYDQESCMERAANGPQQISSTSWGTTMAQGGIFDSVSTDNPFASANKIFVPYCTSDAWLGDQSPQQTQAAYGFNWSFRGTRVLHAVFAALQAEFGLGAAPGAPQHRMLLGGCSAGARGAMYLLDSVAQGVPDGLTVVGMLDSPLWINVAPYDPSVPSLLDQCQLAYSLFNASASVPPACIAAYPETPFYCLMGEYLMPFLTTPYFLNQAQFDSFQLPYNIGGWPQLSIPAQMSYADSWQASMVQALDALPTATQTSSTVFSLSCLRHCLTMGPAFWSAHVLNVTMASALSDWFFDAAEGGTRTMGTCLDYNRCVMC